MEGCRVTVWSGERADVMRAMAEEIVEAVGAGSMSGLNELV